MIPPRIEEVAWSAVLSKRLFGRPVPPDRLGLLMADNLHGGKIGLRADILYDSVENAYRDYERRKALEA